MTRRQPRQLVGLAQSFGWVKHEMLWANHIPFSEPQIESQGQSQRGPLEMPNAGAGLMAYSTENSFEFECSELLARKNTHVTVHVYPEVTIGKGPERGQHSSSSHQQKLHLQSHLLLLNHYDHDNHFGVDIHHQPAIYETLSGQAILTSVLPYYLEHAAVNQSIVH